MISYDEYRKRRLMWDEVRQCIGLDAEFWEGSTALLFPPVWLDEAERRWTELQTSRRYRQARSIGVDPAEGGDKTCMAAVDEYGLIELIAKKTPNTAIIGHEIRAFAIKHKLSASAIVLDRGGGGKQIADQLRLQNFPVRTIPFGSPVVKEPRNRRKPRFKEKIEQREDAYAYSNRRAEMYGLTSQLLDPSIEGGRPRIAIPPTESELRRQLALIPKTYDPEGRLYIYPKHRKSNRASKQSDPTLTEILGCSPDEADAFVIAIWAMLNPAGPTILGTMW